MISQAALKIIAKGILEGTEACRSLDIPEDYAFGNFLLVLTLDLLSVWNILGTTKNNREIMSFKRLLLNILCEIIIL